MLGIDEREPAPVSRTPPGRKLRDPSGWWAVLWSFCTRPPVMLTILLFAFALVSNGLVAEWPRFGAGLAGGRLLPVASLGQTWSDYLASWHPAAGGTGSPAPPALLVLAVAGTVLAPVGGPATVVALLMLFGVPLAGLTGYFATRGLAVGRTPRAVAAGAYALLPAATLSAAQGRLDVVVAHVMLPPLLMGVAAIVGLTRSGHWLGTACRTAFGLAVLGAFAPLMHAVLVVLALLGFVLLPSEVLRPRRRIAGLVLVVFLPVACLLPWPVVLFRNPQLLVHGLGARITEEPAGAWLLALSPDGSPASWLGLLVVLAAVAALVIAPAREMIPGAVVALAGWLGAALLGVLSAEPITGGPSTTGWTGGPLLLTAAGLLAVVLNAGRPRWRVLPRIAVPVLVVSLLAVASAAAVGGRSGPLRAQQGSDAAAKGSGSLLAVEPGPQPARWTGAQGSRFGDDDLAPAVHATEWLRGVEADLLSTDRQRVRSALAAAAAHGAGTIAVPGTAAAPLRANAADLVADQGRLDDGRSVLRVLLPHTPVQLLGPDLARQARIEPSPAPEARPLPVQTGLPNATVRVSGGGTGRLLVLGSQNEAGWRASIDGREAPLTSAWGNQVAVPLPDHSSAVNVSYTTAPRTSLLALQAAAILFALVGALPERIRVPRMAVVHRMFKRRPRPPA